MGDGPVVIQNILNPEVEIPGRVQYFLDYNNQAEKLDQLSKVIIGIIMASSVNNTDPRCEKSLNFFETGRCVVSVSRSPGLIIKFATGWAFYKIEDKIVNEYTRDDGAIVQDIQKVVVKRDWMDIACDCLLLVARLLNPIVLLHKLGVFALAQHFKGICTTIGCMFTGVTVLCFIQSLRDFIYGVEGHINKEIDRFTKQLKYSMDVLKKLFADLLYCISNLLAIPGEWCMTPPSPGWAIAVGVAFAASGAIGIAKDQVYP